MKIIRYNILAYQWVWNEDTQETEKRECLAEIEAPYSEENYQKAIAESYNGEYTIEGNDYAVAPRNIVSGEYITIGNALYLATENIPNGEPVIVGQNAVKTTVEEQLNELKGE